MEWGKNNVNKYKNYVKDAEGGIAEFYLVDGKDGFSANAPYDRILVNASAKVVPEEWRVADIARTNVGEFM